ncbi:hypothetical protein TSUD_211030 [Trifolium subterraneum]|uniref:TF-B3 domain-containing protein n=1 Tax=Trifolium subterraneum TaxID=3900 RepID=A0A2Z6NUG1_TRISU|nr:hypothetical protein TSUD_211030 [Trifolium subterraneum]
MIIYPQKEEIQICPKFKATWIKELRRQCYGWLKHRFGQEIQIDLHLKDDDSYMTSGRIAATMFEFSEPTHVILHYDIWDNKFRMTVIENPGIINLDSDNEDEDCIIIPNPDPNRFNVETIIDDANYEDDPLNDYSIFRWDVVHIPPDTAEKLLTGREHLLIHGDHKMSGIQCTIKTYKRKEGDRYNRKIVEKYLTKGWYDWVRANNLKQGDVLHFELSDPPNVLNIEIDRVMEKKKKKKNKNNK